MNDRIYEERLVDPSDKKAESHQEVYNTVCENGLPSIFW